MKRTQLLILLPLVVAFVLSCEQRFDPISEEQGEYFIENLQTQFNDRKFSEVIPYDFQVDWEAYTEGYSEKLESEYYEFDIFYTSDFNPIALGMGSQRKYTLLALKADDNNTSFFIADFSGTTNQPQSLRLDSMEGFTGLLRIRDTDNQTVNISLYTDGILAGTPKEMSKEEFKAYKLAGRPDLPPEDCGDCDGGIGGGSYILVRTDHYTDYYNYRGDGVWEYQNTVYTGATYEYVYQESNPNAYYSFSQHPNYSSGGGASGSGQTGTVSLEESTVMKVEEIILASSFKNTKAECIYNKLNSLSTSFKVAIRKFDGDFPVAHLKFSVENLGSTKRAQTHAPENYIIEIKINNSSSNAGISYRPNLLTAKTIIHEVIHAEMFRKLLSLSNSNGSIDTSKLVQMLQQGDYPGMLDYYARYGRGFQHQQMAQHYRETIGRVLQEYDTGVSMPSNQTPMQLYMDLAWEGLNHSSIAAWQNVISEQERNRINQSISNYINQYKNENCTP